MLSYYDTTKLTDEHPFDPEGFLFTYFPSETPPAFHYHNFLELGYCEGGSGTFFIDGERVPFDGKCVSIIYDGQVHIAQSVDVKKSLWHFLYIVLEKLFKNVNTAKIKALKYHDQDSYCFLSIVSYKDDPSLYNLVFEVLNEAANCKENYLFSVQALVYAVLIRHGRYMVADENIKATRRKQKILYDKIGDLLNYMNSNYARDITVDDMCSVANMSKATIQRKMIACTGFSPMQYIHHLRLNNAAVLLANKSLSIGEIANRVGYNSISSFNRKFLEQFHMSPGEWRKPKNG